MNGNGQKAADEARREADLMEALKAGSFDFSADNRRRELESAGGDIDDCRDEYAGETPKAPARKKRTLTWTSAAPTGRTIYAAALAVEFEAQSGETPLLFTVHAFADREGAILTWSVDDGVATLPEFETAGRALAAAEAIADAIQDEAIADVGIEANRVHVFLAPYFWLGERTDFFCAAERFVDIVKNRVVEIEQ